VSIPVAQARSVAIGASVISVLSGLNVVTAVAIAAVTGQIVATELIVASATLAHGLAQPQKNHVRHVTDRE
jgi:galactitol-specific phosphotransferase system IIB component